MSSKTTLHLSFAWQRLHRKVDAWSIKTRVMALLGICAAIGLLLFVVWLMPLMATQSMVKQQLKKVTTELRSQQNKYDETIGKQQTLEAAAMKQIAADKKQLSVLDKVIDASVGSSASVASAMSMLQSTFNQQAELQLVYLKKLPMQAIRTDDSKSLGLLSQQIIQLSFKGDFFATASFLQALEEKKWPGSWDNMLYQVDLYPNATVQLQLSLYSIGKSEDE